MTGVEFIVKALEIVGIPQEYFYSINVQPQYGNVTLQGKYSSANVLKLVRKGFAPKIDDCGHTIAEIKGGDSEPTIRVVLT